MAATAVAAADLGDIGPVDVLHYNEVYIANGWAVEAFDNGTRFTNNDSSRMFWVGVTDADTLGRGRPVPPPENARLRAPTPHPAGRLTTRPAG
ncbi:hypothetical protein GCM10023147_34980 [Tsukamurella soli]|uniref:Uncharacterized protein n=2 Tax=Tsukamurella soli TaxID=644556 RepID=A0ABP8JZU1_9ACTN